jgi:beta-N-acetylhexosaminidase
MVADVAGWYCDTLAAYGIMCTIKHFPGLGRVKLDTHRTAGDIKVPSLELQGADWVPFQHLMHRPYVATMLAHVRLADVDKDTPASFSKAVVTGLMRGQWRHDGVLVTDDLSMGAVTRGPEGIGGAAIKSLNAGADLLLVSYSDRDLDNVMTSLIEAETAGLLDQTMRARSLQRLARMTRQASNNAHQP